VKARTDREVSLAIEEVRATTGSSHGTVTARELALSIKEWWEEHKHDTTGERGGWNVLTRSLNS
jgi:hypothetical protein